MAKQYTIISYEIMDTEGNRTSMPVKYKTGEVNTVALAQGVVNEFVPLFEKISKCTIVGVSVEFALTLTDAAVVTALATGAEDFYTNDRGATLSYITTNEVGDSIFVPGWDLDKMSNKVVSTAAADVGNFLNALLGAGITGGYKAVDRAGDFYASYVRGRQTTRK